MDNIKPGNASPTTDENDLVIELEPNIEDVEVLKAEIAKKNEALKQVLARAKGAEAKLKEVKAPVEAPNAPKETISNGANFDDMLELRLQGHSKEAVDFIMKNGGVKSLDNPFVKLAVSAIKEQSKAESSVKTVDSSKSEIEQKYTQEQLHNMSAEELYKVLPRAKKI